MGLLDDAKDKLGDAAEWVKDRAEHLGEQAQGAGQSLGERAADARHWVGSRVVGDTAPEPGAGGDSTPASRVGGDGTVEPSAAQEWVEVTSDGSTVDAGAADDLGGDAPTAADDDPEQDRSV